MIIKKYSIFLVFFMALTFYGCKLQPVKAIDNAPIHGAGHHSAHDVEKIILRAGSDLGWGMKAVRPGVIMGTIYLRTHMAKIRIHYSRSHYSISYVDSTNLKYDGTNIHSGYNGWVSNLEKRIEAMLTEL